MKRLVLAALCCASCQSYELKLAFDVPPRYRSAVSELEVQLVSKPQPDSGTYFDCDAIAFEEVTGAEVFVRQESAWHFPAGGSFSLGDVRRTGDKLFIVNGVGADGGRVVAGCGEVGEVMGSSEVTVPAYPVVHFFLNTDHVDFGGAAAPTPLTVTAVDALGSSGFVPFRYAVDTIESLIDQGVVFDGGLQVKQPAHRGPFSVSIVPRWSADPVRVLPGMYDPVAVPVMLSGVQPSSMRAGHFMGDGGSAIALLFTDGMQQERAVWIAASSGGLSPQPIGAVDAGALVSMRQPHGVDRVFAWGDNTLWELEAQQGLVRHGSLPAGASSLVPFDLTCTGSPLGFFVNQPQQFVAIDELGNLAAGGAPFPLNSRVLGAGCITSVADGGLLPTFVVETETDRLLVDLSGGPPAPWWGVGKGVTFSVPPHAPRQLVAAEAVGASFDLIVVQPLQRSLAALGQDDFGALPQKPLTLVSGDFDGNGLLDVASLIVLSFDPMNGQPLSYGVFVMLQGPGGRRIAGTLPLAEQGCPPDIDAVDLVGGSGDELIAATLCPKPVMPPQQQPPPLVLFSFEPGG